MTTIHPALLPRNISKLPVSLQRVARHAMSQGSWTATSSTSIQQLATVRPEESLGLLPVIYALLDPSLIPSLDTMTTMTLLGATYSTMTSWRYLESAIRRGGRMFPVAANIDLWPRLWPWIEFISSFSDELMNASDAAKLFRPAVEIVLTFSMHPPTQLAMVSTPGLRRVIAALWSRCIVTFDREGDISKQVGHIASALNALEGVKDPLNLSEVLDGCGGPEALCLTLTCTIDLAAKHPTLTNAVTAVGGVCLLLDQMITFVPHMFPFLLSCGFIPPLVSALGVLGSSSPAHPSRGSFPNALAALLSCMGLGYTWVEEALPAGLLNQLVFWGSKPDILHATDPQVTKQLQEIIKDVLPPTLVYYPLILAMKMAFANVASPSSDGESARSGLYGPWSKLKALLDERTTILERWEENGRPSPMVCYNIECSKVTTKRDDFRRCSACQTVAYCSQACQRVDWTQGHREDCRSHRDAHLAFARFGLDHRLRSFLRTLLHTDYMRRQVPIAMDMVRFMANNPDIPLFVDFDYTRGPAEVKVLPLSMLDGSEIVSPHSQRLARAGGRLVAHNIRFGHESTAVDAIWPLCASTSEFFNGLQEIARTTEGLEDAELDPRVLELI